MVLTWQFSLILPSTVSSHADKAVAGALAPQYPFVFGLVASPPSPSPPPNAAKFYVIGGWESIFRNSFKTAWIEVQESNASPISHGGFLCPVQICPRAAESCWSLLLCLTKEVAQTLNPVTAPAGSPKAPGEACSSRAEAGCSPASISPGAGAATPRRGAAPSQRWIARCTRQKYLKIQEKSSSTVPSVQSHIPPLGTAGSGLRSVCSGGIRAEARGAGKRLSILPWPVCWWVYSWWRAKKRSFSLMLWLFVMEGSFRGEEESQKLGCVRLSAILPGLLWLCLRYCTVQLLQRFEGPEWQCGPWMLPGTWPVPVNLQAYKTASWVTCTKKKEASLEIKGIHEPDFILHFIWFLNWHDLFKSTCTMVVGTFLFRLCTAEVRCLTLDYFFFIYILWYFVCGKKSFFVTLSRKEWWSTLCATAMWCEGPPSCWLPLALVLCRAMQMNYCEKLSSLMSEVTSSVLRLGSAPALSGFASVTCKETTIWD